MKKRFTEEQIIGVLKEAEAVMKVAELCRKHGISEPTYKRLWDEIKTLEDKIERLERDREDV